jgi:hypothetical protein
VRHRTIEEVPDRDAPTLNTPRERPLNLAPASGQSCVQVRPLRRYKGLFVEEFPDPLAGAPVSEDRVPEPDLATYMRSCGPMASLDYFKVAELLMTSRLSDANKDRHLKSKIVSNVFNSKGRANS